MERGRAAFKLQCLNAFATFSSFDRSLLPNTEECRYEQDAQLSQRDRAAWCVIVLAKSGRLELGDNILRTLDHCEIMGLKICRIRWKKTQNKGYNGVQGHSRSSRSVPMESPNATSYLWLIVTDILSRTVSELSQLIVQILDTAFLRQPSGGGLKDNVQCSSGAHWKTRSRLPISVNWTFSLGVTAEALRANISWKWAISLQWVPVDPTFHVEEIGPH